MTDPLPIARPWLGDEEREAVLRPLARGWLMQGEEVAAFEDELARALGAAHVCVVGSGTAALHLALLAQGIGPGDEVVTASASYIATANAVRHAGATPVFADVREATGNLDPESVERALSSRTRALLVPHQLGMPADMTALLALAERADLPVIEDAACALGSAARWGDGWQPVGQPRGLAATLSFHPRKVITTGEGGAVVTSDPAVDARVRLLRQQGRGADGTHDAVGYNYRMTDLQAAIGRAQLARLEAIVLRRRALAERYAAGLRELGLEPPAEPDWARSNWQSYALMLPLPARRDMLRARLAASGIATRTGVECAHREPAYADHPQGWRAGDGLTASEARQDRGLMLPLFPEMDEGDVERVLSALRG